MIGRFCRKVCYGSEGSKPLCYDRLYLLGCLLGFIESFSEMSSDIGIYGLTSQGIQLALNFASKGYLVTVGNKSSDKVRSDLIDI